MQDDEKQITPQQLAALGVGILVTIGSSVLTTLISPIAFPFNYLISVFLGGMAGLGALKVLDPRTQQDVVDAQMMSSYQHMLTGIKEVADRTSEASHSLRHISPEVSQRLGKIARMTRMILERYQNNANDYSKVSYTLLIHQRFAEILAHYIKVKSGELFLDEEQVEREIFETEKHTIPMFETGLESLGRKLDAGEALDTGITKGTLESMLRSLNLIDSLSNQFLPSLMDKETHHD